MNSLFVVEADERFDMAEVFRSTASGRYVRTCQPSWRLVGIHEMPTPNRARRRAQSRHPAAEPVAGDTVMDIHNLDRVEAFITKDGSEIRELLAHRNSSIVRQSLAEARVSPGATTTCHRHLRTEEIYYISGGPRSHADRGRGVPGWSRRRDRHTPWSAPSDHQRRNLRRSGSFVVALLVRTRRHDPWSRIPPTISQPIGVAGCNLSQSRQVSLIAKPPQSRPTFAGILRPNRPRFRETESIPARPDYRCSLLCGLYVSNGLRQGDSQGCASPVM